MKNLLKVATLPSDVRCSTDVRSFLIARTSGHFRTSDTSTTETFLRMSGTLRTSDTFTSEALLRMSGPARTSVSCTLGCGSHFHSGRSSDDCRTSGPICASGRPTFSGRPAILYPKWSLFPTTYIYSLPFHGIGLTIHF